MTSSLILPVMKMAAVRSHACRAQEKVVTTLQRMGGIEVKLHTLLTWTLSGGEWSASCSDRFIQYSHWILGSLYYSTADNVTGLKDK
jgi:hypothetical protein